MPSILSLPILPYCWAYPGATIFSFDYAPLKTITYRETAYYQLYKDFLDDPEKYLKAL